MSITDPILTRVTVRQAMHTGVLVTEPTTPLRVLARLMSEQCVHAIAVMDPGGGGRPFGLVTAHDIAAAIARDAEESTAGQIVSDDFVSIASSSSVADAARLMATRGVSHLLVIEPATGRTAGIISSLDVVAAFAG